MQKFDSYKIAKGIIKENGKGDSCEINAHALPLILAVNCGQDRRIEL